MTSPELGDTVEVDEPLDLELEILDGRHQLLLPRLGAQQSATPCLYMSSYYLHIYRLSSTISTYLLPPANLTDLPMLLTGFCLQLPAKLVAEVSSVIREMRGL